MMKDRTLLYFMSENNDDLIPDDSQTLNINDKEWYISLKPFFNDLIWEYFAHRVVFIDERFKYDDSDETIINKIKRSFAINLKTRNYEYENLYESTVLEFNPLWNVDGVEGIIREYETDSSGTLSRTGIDTIDTKDGGSVTNYGNNSIDNSGSDETTNSKSTYDSGADLYDVDRSSVVYGKGVTELKSNTETRNLTGQNKTTYNSSNSDSNNTQHKELEMHIKQGNIGVTKSTELIDDYRKTSLFDFYKLVVKDCVNTCTYAVE